MNEILTLQDMPVYLETVKESQWEMLFRFIPLFETLTREDIEYDHDWASIPKIESEYHRFFELVYDLKLIVQYNWSFWSYNERMIAGDADLSEFSPIELCMMLTRIVRGDRFNQNYLVGCIVDGTIPNILKGFRCHYGKG